MMRPRVNLDLYKRYVFFKNNAGYIVGQKAQCALALARSEIWLEANEYTCIWDYDYDADLGDHEYWCSKAIEESYLERTEGLRHYHSHECFWCQLWDKHGHMLASLGSIIDPSTEYMRVIQAELALEAYEQCKAKESHA
jgi:hypothetical protein